MLIYTVSGIISAWIIKSIAESIQHGYSEIIQLSSNQSMSESLPVLFQNSLNGTDTDLPDFSKDIAFKVIVYSFILNGFIQIFVGLACLVFPVHECFKNISANLTKQKIIQKTCKKIESKSNEESKSKLNVISKVCVLLFTSLTTFQLMLEMGYAGLLITFLVDHLKWTTSEALVMSSVLFLSNTVGKVFAIPLTKFISPAKLLGATCVVNTIMVIMLSILVDIDISIIWICTILSGSMSAIQLPTILTWASTVVTISGKVASVVAGLPYAIVMMIGVLSVGFLMDEFGPMSYSYSMAVTVLITNVLFVVTWYSAKVLKRHTEVKAALEMT